MMDKIVSLNPNRVSWRTLLHQTLDRENVEAVVMAIRIDGCWHTAWCNETNAGLCMAAMKLHSDVLDWIHSEPETRNGTSK